MSGAKRSSFMSQGFFLTVAAFGGFALLLPPCSKLYCVSGLVYTGSGYRVCVATCLTEMQAVSMLQCVTTCGSESIWSGGGIEESSNSFPLPEPLSPQWGKALATGSCWNLSPLHPSCQRLSLLLETSLLAGVGEPRRREVLVLGRQRYTTGLKTVV